MICQLYYMIINEETGLYLPQINRRGIGKTWIEFTKDKPPRLFKRKNDASNCLNWWKKGKFYMKRSYFNDEYDGDLEVDTSVNRDIENVKVIQVIIQDWYIS